MDENKRKLSDLSSDKPVGPITPIGSNGYGRDENGQIFRLESAEAIERKRAAVYRKLDKRFFTFANMRTIRELTDNLSNKHCGYVLMLQPYIQFETNVLITPGRTEAPMTAKQIGTAIGIRDKRTYTKVLSELENDDVVLPTTDGNYVINDRYHFRKKVGKESVDILIKTFHTTVRDLKLKPAEMGVLYKLLPYVHYETNLICEDPFEVDPTKVRFLNASQIAEKGGVSRQKVSEVIRALDKAGAIAQVQRKLFKQLGGDKREALVILNPYIFYRKQGKPDALLMQIFNAKN
jgi:DNA-binding MarR family transcriptional regulator